MSATEHLLRQCRDRKLALGDYMNVYKTRWQIELVFKIWKSTCYLEKVKKVGKNRLLAYLYGRLLLILICWKMSWVATYYIQNEPGKMLSFHKGIKTLVNDMENLRVAILGAPSVLKTFIAQYIAISYKYHLLEKRKDRIDVKEILIQL